MGILYINYTFEDMRKIYNALEDEISKEIFIARINYSATLDIKYVIEI